MSAMQLVGVPAAMMDTQGRLQRANALFYELAGKKIFDRNDQLCFENSKVQEEYKLYLGDLENAKSGRSFAVHDDNERPIIIHIIPSMGPLKEIFNESAAILVISSGNTKATLPSILLESLFGLSPAEARVVRMLCEGFRPEEIARRCQLSPSTVRSHLKSVFSKTHTHRQKRTHLAAGQLQQPAYRKPSIAAPHAAAGGRQAIGERVERF